MGTAPNRTGQPNEPQNIRELNTNIAMEEYTARLGLLYDVAQKASSYSEVLKLIEATLCVTNRILQTSASLLLLIDEGTGLCFQAGDDKAASTLRKIRLSPDLGIIRWVAHKGRPATVNDVSIDKRFSKNTDEVSGLTTKSIMAVPLLRGEKVIGVLGVLNKVDGNPFNEQDLAVLTGFASTEALTLLVSTAAIATHITKLRQAKPTGHQSAIETLAAAADIKDPYACGHSQRVREYTMLAASSLGFSPEELRVIEFGALLHDVGKIGIGDRVLAKPSSLNDEEWPIMRNHSLIGANIVGEIPFLEKARGIVLNHHEWYDGTGYPDGLKGEDIPIGARLVAVADAFDTITTEHSYRGASGVDDAIDELIRGIGTQFCPVAVKAFVSALSQQKDKLAKELAERAAKGPVTREAEAARKTRDVDSSAVWREKGAALVKLGRNAQALEALEKATKLDPKNAAAWRSKGTALGRLGRHEKALEALVKAIELDPKNVAAWHNKAIALKRLGRDKEASQARDSENLLEKEAKRAAKAPAKVAAA